MQEKSQLYADKNRPNVDKIRLFIDKKGVKIKPKRQPQPSAAAPQP